MIVGRIGMREVAADGRAVSHQRIGDDEGGVVQNRILRLDQIRSLQRRLAGPAADLQVSAFFLDVFESGNPSDVDQMSHGREPQLEQRQQALSTRQHLGIVAVLLEQANRLGQRRRGVIIERRRDHRALLSDDLTTEQPVTKKK